MLRLLFSVVFMAASLLAAEPLQAQPADAPTAEQQAEVRRLQALLDNLHPQTGAISIPQAHAVLNLGEDYYFLNAAEAKTVLTQAWGNPPEAVTNVLGMVFPAGKTPLDETWGAVISYTGDGYVSDQDAHEIDYSQLLQQMRTGEAEDNRRLQEAGYPTSHLVGWAQQPTYDAQRHNLIWAKEIAFGSEPEHTLNYDVRVLGRRGVLSMNIVAPMGDLSTVSTDAAELMNTADFDAGSRYSDYRQGDPTAAYGVAGLVAGGAAMAVAKKAGLLGILFLVLKKGWVFLLAGGAAALNWLRARAGGRKTGSRPRPTEPPPPSPDL